MKVLRKINKDIYYIGGSDLRLELFENLFPLTSGVSYNSYFIDDEKTCVLDTVDSSVADCFFEELDIALKGRTLDYLIVQHLEPDHSSCIRKVLEKHPKTTLVVNARCKDMLFAMLEQELTSPIQIVKENDILKLGRHELTFVMAPMVHWPEVMVTYDLTDNILFSADAFGTFGALSGNIFNDEMPIDKEFFNEARRYYTNIVGKFGGPVQKLLAKAKTLPIQMICPLHGPIWRTNLETFIEKYDLWSRYEAEDDEIIILYASMYNNTYYACMDLANLLANQGIKNIKLYDVSKTDVSYLIAEIFRVRKIVLASPNYNGGIYPKMLNLLEDMKALSVKNKIVGLIENGSWALVVAKQMKEHLDAMGNMKVVEPIVQLKTTVKEENIAALEALSTALINE
ncbi:MAG: FprA family A-type flavoprotein [Anaeroplasmataceae bacterium]|nr:FprA family A-type flavoprotein [Anaeroplasmataceae bacterium]HRF70126.1 FprA family A-type flavoprotein [Candidatus Pelethenecus sp.]